MPRFIVLAVIGMVLNANLALADVLILNPGDSFSTLLHCTGDTPTGTVLAHKSQSIDIVDGPVTLLSGTFEQQVFQNPSTRDLTFYYSFNVSSEGVTEEATYNLSSFTGFTTSVQPYVSPIGVGTEAGTYSRSTDGSTLTGYFLSTGDDSPNVNFGGVSVVTDATSFDTNGLLTLEAAWVAVPFIAAPAASDAGFPDAQTQITVFEPTSITPPGVPLPPAFVPGIIGLLLVAAIRYLNAIRTYIA